MGGYYKLSAGQLSSPDGLAYLYSAEQKSPESDTQSLERTGAELLYSETDSGNQRQSSRI